MCQWCETSVLIDLASIDQIKVPFARRPASVSTKKEFWVDLFVVLVL